MRILMQIFKIRIRIRIYYHHNLHNLWNYYQN
jgi:hypothetical protein